MRYVLVGGVGTSVNYAAFLTLLLVGLPYAAASAIGYAVGTLAAYTLNRRWTFGIREHRLGYLVRYGTVQLTGMASTVAVLALLVEVAGVPSPVAQLIALAIVNLATFELNRRWSFAAPAPATSG